ncbi:MAG: hypothetical protein AAB355_00445 [Patescibacteria group bacterium]
MQFNSAIIGNNIDRAAFTSIASFLGIVVAFYLYFIGATIFFTVERKVAESEIRNISTMVSALEIEYLGLSNSLSIEHARALGFKDSNNQTFVTRKGSVGSLSLRDNGN